MLDNNEKVTNEILDNKIRKIVNISNICRFKDNPDIHKKAATLATKA